MHLSENFIRFRPVADAIEDEVAAGWYTGVPAAAWPDAKARLDALAADYVAFGLGDVVYVYGTHPCGGPSYEHQVSGPGLAVAYQVRVILNARDPEWVQLSERWARLVA